MGIAKEMMEESRFNDEIIEFLEEQLRCDELKGAAEGIAKFAIDNGVEKLSEEQRALIDSELAKFKKEHICERCDNDNVSTISEYIHLKDSDLCPMCEYDKEKFMRD